jgi:porin
MHPSLHRLILRFLSVTAVAVLCLNGRAELRTGLDLSLDGTVGLAGAARAGESLHGVAIGHLHWIAGDPDAAAQAEVHLSVLTLHGRGPTERYLGDFLAASNTEGPVGTRLYAWWLEAGRNAWSLRLGAQLGDEEFATTEGGAEFLNSGFGWPAFISANTLNTGPAYAVPALGVRLRHTWSERGAWQLGLYDGDTFDSAEGDPRVNRHGTSFGLGGEQGCFLIAEAAWSVPVAGATLKAGGWLHTADFADLRDDAAGRPHALTGAEPRLHGSNYGLYVAGEFLLGGAQAPAEHAVRLFVRAGVAPADRSTIAWSVDAGLTKRGLLPGRPADVAHLGLVHAAFSPRLAEHERLLAAGGAASDHELVIEAGYTIALTGNWSLKPDLQFIRYAGGGADALVLLLRSQHSF